MQASSMAVTPEAKKLRVGREVLVQPGTSLQDVLNGAHAGSVVILAKGKHFGNIDIPAGVTIECIQGSSLTCNKEFPTVTVSAAGATLRGLDISHGYCDSLPRNSQVACINVRAGGSLLLERCTVSGSGSGLEVVGGVINLKDCIVSNTGGRGALLTKGAHGTLNNCKVSNTHGVVVEGSHLNFNNCTVSGGRMDGIVIAEGAKAFGRTSEIFGNKESGARVEGAGSELILDSSKLYNNGEDGMLVVDTAKVQLLGSEVFENHGDGVRVQESSQLTTTNCKLYGGNESGLAFTSGSRGRVTDCHVYRNGEAGVLVEASAVSMTGTQIHHGGTVGILVVDSAKASIQGCKMFDNKHGELRVEVRSQVHVGKCELTGLEGQPGVLLVHGGQAVIQDCQMRANVRMEDCARVLMDRCTVGMGDIVFMNDSAGSLRGCVFLPGPDHADQIINLGTGCVNVEGCASLDGEAVCAATS